MLIQQSLCLILTVYPMDVNNVSFQILIGTGSEITFITQKWISIAMPNRNVVV